MELCDSTLGSWTRSRSLPWVGTNAGSEPLPFQRWHHFKEAFAPELIARAEAQTSTGERILDPFGGSGTTALACQFLGVDTTTFEVNPFLADVIRSKLQRYDADSVRDDLEAVLASAQHREVVSLPDGAPRTLIEPGWKKRYVFHSGAGQQILRLREEIAVLSSSENSRLLRVLLGGTLNELSNVRVNGKGRRYRRNWEQRSDPDVAGVNDALRHRTEDAIADIERFEARDDCDWKVINGDSRRLGHSESYGAVVCSPPYPNSFDYTDVYNLELWMLGYLNEDNSNRALREATLSSHVQIQRDFATAPAGSEVLDSAIAKLEAKRAELWSPWIPEMVGAYFSDLLQVFERARPQVRIGGKLWLVVGDSQYKGELIPVASALSELLGERGWDLEGSGESRSMRVSPQQGGQQSLDETLLILSRCA